MPGSSDTRRRHLILSVASADAYLSLTRSILSRIGYEIVDHEDWADAPSLFGHVPRLCVVDDHRLGDVPKGPAFERIPILLLAGQCAVKSDDPRVVGSLLRPAGPHELFRLLQAGLEPHPRSALRAPVDLPATLLYGGRSQDAWIHSISENGCLARTRDGIALGTQLALSFVLPGRGPLSIRAEAAYQLVPDNGIVFHATSSEERRALLGYVEAQLAGAALPSAAP